MIIQVIGDLKQGFSVVALKWKTIKVNFAQQAKYYLFQTETNKLRLDWKGAARWKVTLECWWIKNSSGSQKIVKVITNPTDSLKDGQEVKADENLLIYEILTKPIEWWSRTKVFKYRTWQLKRASLGYHGAVWVPKFNPDEYYRDVVRLLYIF